MKRPPYPGGKNALNTHAVTRWIGSLLPVRERYIEPFAGLAGVLISRPRSRVEVINDLDGRVHNWWTAVRDQPDELRRLLAATPVYSQRHFAESKTKDGLSGAEGAYWFTLHMMWGFNGMTTEGSGRRIMWGVAGRPDMPAASDPMSVDLESLAERMRGVGVENMDAVEMLERTAPLTDAVVYCDPPYPSITGALYRHSELDGEALTERLLSQKGAAAVSGYGKEWDHLGWRRFEMETKSGFDRRERVRNEVLWTNFEPGADPARLFTM